MQYAIYLDQKIEAEPKLRGLCPHCELEVIAKCGEKNIWHWAHAQSENCDAWSEPETHWHRNWKKQFGAECSEVRIQKDNVYHVADVVNKGGIVFEFQNSPISARVIKEREKFYGERMIWIVNGAGFKDHFHIFDEEFLKNWKFGILDEFSGAAYPTLKNSLIIESWQVKLPVVKDLLEKEGFVYYPAEKAYGLDLSGQKHANREQLIIKFNARLLDLYNASKVNDFSGKTEFVWDHAHRSWQEAGRPLFIDFGGDFLYYFTSGHGKKSGTGNKIPKLKFIAKYCGD